MQHVDGWMGRPHTHIHFHTHIDRHTHIHTHTSVMQIWGKEVGSQQVVTCFP